RILGDRSVAFHPGRDRDDVLRQFHRAGAGERDGPLLRLIIGGQGRGESAKRGKEIKRDKPGLFAQCHGGPREWEALLPVRIERKSAMRRKLGGGAVIPGLFSM